MSMRSFHRGLTERMRRGLILGIHQLWKRYSDERHRNRKNRARPFGFHPNKLRLLGTPGLRRSWFTH